jgi:predicted glycoside hydrolase/deacetylase ChbG (UPF0249 family)
MMKVIFNGDDFGLTTGINKGIIQSYKDGLLTSASIVASGEAAEEAISLAKQNEGMDVGIHLILSDERPLLPPERISSIISEDTFFPSRQKIFQTIITRKIDYNQVEAEWCAQIETCFNSGLAISHIDSHQFIHLFPTLFQLTLRLARTYKIPYVRTAIFDTISLESGLKRFFQWILLKFWILYYISPKVPEYIKTIPSIGFLQAGGRMNVDTLLSTLETIRMKQMVYAVEVMLHPGIADKHTVHKYSSWRYKWANDVKLLQQPSLAEALDSRGIEIVSYRDLI